MPDLPSPAATAARAILAGQVRNLLTAIGATLVARGVIDQGTADVVLPPIATELAGAALIAAASAWSWIRAQASHSRYADAFRRLIEVAK